MINCEDITFNNNNIKYTNPLKNKVCIKNFLNKESCNLIIKKSEEYGNWANNRHKNYPTTDIPIDMIPNIEEIKNNLITEVSFEVSNNTNSRRYQVSNDDITLEEIVNLFSN